MATNLDPYEVVPPSQRGDTSVTTGPTTVRRDPVDQLQDQDSQYNWWSDMGHAVAAGTGSMGASISGAVGWLAGAAGDKTGVQGFTDASNVLDDWRKAADSWSAGQASSESPLQQSVMSQPFFSGVWTSNPWRYAVGQFASMAPALVSTLAATALTGGIADIMAAGVGASEVGAAAVGTGVRTATMFGGWGTLSAGDVVDQINQAIDNVPDTQLQATNPIYAGYRANGMSEDAARAKYARDAAGVAPAVAFTIGGLAGIFGGPGQLARAFGGDVAGQVIDSSGLIKRTLGGALVGATVVLRRLVVTTP